MKYNTLYSLELCSVLNRGKVLSLLAYLSIIISYSVNACIYCIFLFLWFNYFIYGPL